MARSQQRSKKKSSGGVYHSSRSKRKNELAGFSAMTKVSEENKTRTKRTLGGNSKSRVLSTNIISVADQKGKVSKTEIVNVIENQANPNLVRRNIITKGAVVETKLGKVKITSRPGQNAVISGVLL
jgi:small subunit ribosomal protein S8e